MAIRRICLRRPCSPHKITIFLPDSGYVLRRCLFMGSFNLIGWLKTWFRRRVKTVVKRPRLRLRLEELETRLAPAFVWTGAGLALNDKWSNPANWQGSTIPTTGTPVA